MKVYQLKFDDLVIQVTRKAIKHMYVRIKSPDGQVCVSIPQRANLAYIQQQLEVKMDWIRARRMLQILKAKQMAPSLESGEIISFLGRNHTLTIQPGNQFNPVRIEDDIMHVSVPEQATENDKLRLINRWYRQQFQDILPALIAKWEPVVGVQASAFTVRIMKTRWGSCNTRTSRICLNLNLIKKPLVCLEYVLVHELVHLHEARHNRRFYNLMNQFMPDWQIHHSILEPGSRLARAM